MKDLKYYVLFGATLKMNHVSKTYLLLENTIKKNLKGLSNFNKLHVRRKINVWIQTL